MGTKPGYTTTEFWLTLVTQVLSFIAFFHPEIGDVHRFDGLVQAFAVLASAIGAFGYAHARGLAKGRPLPPAA